MPDGRRPWEPYPLETKREAVKLLADGLGPAAAARRLNIGSKGSVRRWAAKLGGLDSLDARSHMRAFPRLRLAVVAGPVAKPQVGRLPRLYIPDRR